MDDFISPAADLTGTVVKESDHPVARGGYSKIYLGVYTPLDAQSTPVQVGIKVLNTHGDLDIQIKIRRRLRREVSNWRQLDHPGIAKFLGFSMNFDGTFPAIISIWYPNGDARRYLLQHPNADRTKLLDEVASALVYLHGLRTPLVHGDIKAKNVFIKDNGDACLGDLGLSRLLQEESTGDTTTTSSGTCRWMAPELIIGENDESIPRVTKATDVYGFGCLALEISTGEIPWEAIRSNLVVTVRLFQGGTPPRPKGEVASRELDDDLWELIQTCWRGDPSQRPNITFVRAGLRSIRQRRCDPVRGVPVLSYGSDTR
ncbi:hypothetical protein BOTBODRAFT_30405 [Botryobasidium botryosum FD-172 SS1]|uniref:Protein kinase domain-containing protein n=1 Tax=Botryobasidium botryosum (strain FD-172 SS1) TaxID=930990 RepID=A0A067MYN6_BOTB1|nr:hypothetical protein BOTBODRAFT_30405 [Botryobasidium botryosum FD-172 SS1]